MKKIFTIICLEALSVVAFAQAPSQNKATFIEAKPGYYQNTIMKGIGEQSTEVTAPKKQKYLKLDITDLDVPKSVDEFTTIWKQNTISQGNTFNCWSFSNSSYFESEIYRQSKQTIKLSELFNAYWEYVEKAKGFVDSRGTSLFDEGSEANGVVKVMKLYGAVPSDAYDGLQMGKMKIHDHSKMFEEMKSYLQSVKASNNWNKDAVITTIKSILDHYIGTPPSEFNYDGKKYNPKTFLSSACKLNPDDYIDVLSLLEKPYWQKVEYTVPDNWWHNSDYYNVPLDVFMNVVKSSITAGYSLTIGGDVSEPGFNIQNVCMVPSWDIPSEYISEEAREMRFYNKTTTDDHGMHLVGYTQKNGKYWFLVKDSGAGSRNVGSDSKNFGYYFIHEDYIKLKIMDVLVHKDMLKDVLNKF